MCKSQYLWLTGNSACKTLKDRVDLVEAKAVARILLGFF